MLFLIVLAVIAAGFAIYVVAFYQPGVGRGPAEIIGYIPIGADNGNENSYDDNGISDDVNGENGSSDSNTSVDEWQDALGSAGDVENTNSPGSNTENEDGPASTNGSDSDSDPYDDNNPSYYDDEPEYPPYESYIPFLLLTTVDNTLLPWYLKLVNRYNFLDYYFNPQLTSIGHGHYFDSRAYRSLLDMMASARAEGLSPIVASSFRSVSRQTVLFRNRVQRFVDQGYSQEDSFEMARRIVAYPGSSEHNLGLAVDIVAASYQNLTANFGSTAEGIWLAQNSYRYGFVLRYPYHKQDITNIIYEPWHFRYVGRAAAATMFERDLVLEEYVSERIAHIPVSQEYAGGLRDGGIR